MANRANRFIELSEAENEKLRDLEQNPYVKSKVRLRSQILRLSHEGMGMKVIGEYVGKSYDYVRSTFARWEREGMLGLSDHYEGHGQAPVITEEIKGYMVERLEEERTWTCPQLVDAVKKKYRVTVTSEAIRQHLHQLGYSWKRGRFSPAKHPDRAELKRHKAALDTLKRGQQKGA